MALGWVQEEQEMMAAKVGPAGGLDRCQDVFPRAKQRLWAPRWVGEDQEEMGAKMGWPGAGEDDGHQGGGRRTRRR